MIYQTGHFTCYEKRTFSFLLAIDTAEKTVIRPEFEKRDSPPEFSTSD
jgi:hypothetical protein